MTATGGVGPLTADDPERAGPYRLLGRLGIGRIGQVYLGGSEDGRQVAVHVLRDPTLRGTFRGAVEAARRVRSRFAVSFVDADADAAIPWLATEYVEGLSLAELIVARGPLPADAVREVATNLVEALTSAREAGVVHGDLRPSDVVLTLEGPRLSGLGIAAVQVDDVYALGAVLCFAATGGQDPSAVRDPALRALITGCLAVRFRPTLEQVRAMLSQPPRRRRGGQGKWVALGAGVLVVLLVVAAVVFWPSGSPDSPQAKAVPNGFAWSVTKAGDGTGSFIGMWSTGSTVVVGTSYGGLTAYDIATGATLWTWKLPAGGRLPLLCGMSDSTSDGTGALIYGEFVDGGDHCDHLQVISVSTGKPGWAQPVGLTAPGAGVPQRADASKALSISDGVVTAAYVGAKSQNEMKSTQDLIVVDAKTGSMKWSTDNGQGPGPDGCQSSGVAQEFRGMLYTIAQCDAWPSPQLIAYNNDGSLPANHTVPGTGMYRCTRNDPQWDLAQSDFMMAATGDYLLVGCADLGASDEDRYLGVLPAGGTTLGDVDLSVTDAVVSGPDVSGNRLPPKMVLGKDTVYLIQESGSGGGDTGVTAVDPGTGHSQWSTTVPGASTVSLLAATGDGVEIMAGGMSGASLYTVTASGAAKGRDLTAGEVKAFSAATGDDAPHAARVGDYVAVGFPGLLDDGQTVFGVMPSGAR